MNLFLIFFVNVQNELLYTNMEAVYYALKQWSFVLWRLSLICRCFLSFVGIYGKYFSSLYIFCGIYRASQYFQFVSLSLILCKIIINMIDLQDISTFCISVTHEQVKVL